MRVSTMMGSPSIVACTLKFLKSTFAMTVNSLIVRNPCYDPVLDGKPHALRARLVIEVIDIRQYLAYDGLHGLEIIPRGEIITDLPLALVVDGKYLPALSRDGGIYGAKPLAGSYAPEYLTVSPPGRLPVTSLVTFVKIVSSFLMIVCFK